MMRVLSLCCVLAVLWLELPSGGQAVCCYTHRYHKLLGHGHRCKDCSSPFKYCGVGSCNIVGCNCDGGCRQGRCADDVYWSVLGRRDEAPEVEDADDVIRAADADGDGRMSLDEARALLGGALAYDRRSLVALDADNDQYLTAREIDA